MPSAPADFPAGSLEARFEAEVLRDARLRDLFDYGGWAVSLSSVATFLTLIMPLHRDSPWLVCLSLYAITTRLFAFLSWKAFLFPRLLEAVGSGDAEAEHAARAVLEKHRGQIVPRILRDHLLRSDPASVAAADPAMLADLARQHDGARWRRRGRVALGVWCVLSLLLWTTLLVTGGGHRA